jgi:DNA replication protein DnaC
MRTYDGELSQQFHNQAMAEVFTGDYEEHQGSIPEEKEFVSCKTHGEVKARYLPTFEKITDGIRGLPPTGYKLGRYCKQCVSDAEKRISIEYDKALEKKRDEAAYAKRVDDLEFRGVSLRNIGASLDDISPKNAKQAEAIGGMKSLMDAIITGKVAGNMILIGSVGTGKTMLTSGLVCDLRRAGKSPAIRRVIDIIRSMKNTWRKDSETTEDQLIHRLVSLDLLVIDEIGVQFGSDTEKMFIFDIIDGRYNKMKPTILISNLTMQGIKECIGDRCVDRLRGDGGKVIAFDFESQRGKS